MFSTSTPIAGPAHWVVVFKEEEAATALTDGYCQFGRGHAPAFVRDMNEGDEVVMLKMRPPGEPCFLATGRVGTGDAYVIHEQGRDRWRRDVRWYTGQAVPFSLIRLHLTSFRCEASGRPLLNQGRGRLSPADFLCIESALKGCLPPRRAA